MDQNRKQALISVQHTLKISQTFGNVVELVNIVFEQQTLDVIVVVIHTRQDHLVHLENKP